MDINIFDTRAGVCLMVDQLSSMYSALGFIWILIFTHYAIHMVSFLSSLQSLRILT
jgi:hypothetical protein